MDKINNKVLNVSSDKAQTFIKELRSRSNIFIVELNGNEISSWIDYIDQIQNKFRFPTTCFDSIDRYLDWIRDLQWIDNEEIVIIINNYDLFLKDVPDLRRDIISDFVDVILPFWQDDVQEVVVEGKPKRFMVYLIQ